MNNDIIRKNREKIEELKARHAASQKAHEERMAALEPKAMRGEPITGDGFELELNPITIRSFNRCP